MAELEVCLVGRFRVVLDGRELDDNSVGTRKARLLLQRLAAAGGRPVGSESLAATLWPDDPPRSPVDNLATLVSRLRAALGADVVAGDRASWRLGPGVSVDVGEAGRLLTRAESSVATEPAVARAAALGGVRLLQGEVLPGAPDEDWAADLRDGVTGLLRRCRRAAAEAALACGDPAGAVDEAGAAVRTDPYDEGSVRLLMRALARAGEPGRALAVYERLRSDLAAELGADPAPETRDLHLALLTERELPAAATPGPAAASAPAAAASPGTGTPLAGRARELAELSARWTAAAGGTPGLVLVVGEPGIGKTRVAEALARLARDTGGTVLEARCYDTERSLFLQPFADALRAELLRLPLAELRELAGDRASTLAVLVPELTEVLGSQPRDLRSHEAERRMAYDAVATTLRRLATRAPLLLVLDDLQNAGLATVEQLHLLARAAGHERLLVVATVRSDEGAEVLRQLGALPAAHQLVLGPIDDAAVGELAGAAGLADLATSIARRTGGHPLFVVETLRALRSGDEGVPASLTAAVLARVGQLGPEREELVRAAAVLGASFDPTLLAGVLAVPVARTVRGCAGLVDAGLAVAAGRSYEFANDLVQEVLYESTPVPVRAAYHRLAADLLVDRPEALAQHAAGYGDGARAADAWLRAAADATTRFAATDAERLLGLALDAAVQAGDPAITARALLERGRVREALGSYTAALDDLGRALRVSQDEGFEELEMLVRRELAGDAAIGIGRPISSCVPHLEAGLAIAQRRGDHGVEAALLARWAVLACNRLDFVAGRRHGEAAVAAGRLAGDERFLRRGLDGLKTSMAYVGDVEGLRVVVAELEPMARRARDLFLLQWVVFERCFLPLATGDWDAATATVEEALALNRRSGWLRYESWFLAHLGWIARLAGRPEDAVGHGRRAVAALGHSWFGATASSMLACTLLEAGGEAGRLEAVRLLRRGLADADRSGAEVYRLRCLAPLAAATGSPDLLLQADRVLAAARLPAGRVWVHGADAYVCLARGWLSAGDPVRAAATAEAFVSGGDASGWSAVVTASGARAVLDQVGHQTRSASRAATRSAPPAGTGR